MSHRSVDLLCLDAGGVLLFPNWHRVSEVLARHGIVVEADRLAAADLRAKRAMDQHSIVGSTNNAGHGWRYFNEILNAAGIPLSPAAAAGLAELRTSHAAQNLWEVTPADVPLALRRLRDLGLRLAVVSNSDGRLRGLLDRLDLARWFDLVLDSHEEGIEKPDPGLFQIALERSHVLPDRAMHVGDLYHVDVVGARAAGLRAVLLDPAGLYRTSTAPAWHHWISLPT